ncbi:tetratricopeptide repeat protein [candidate division WOR-3 bacterium]|nr:tetratricopeptide repeat protein [candidate division WOR-3 bacterium]
MEYYNSLKPTQALILLKNSDVPREIYLEGTICLHLNNPRRAIRVFDRLLELDSTWCRTVISDLAEASYKAITKGRNFTANLMLNKILQYDPEFELEKRNFFMGDWYFDCNEYDSAITFYEAGLEYDSTNMDARFKLAQCFIYEGELLPAYQSLRKGLEIQEHWRFRYWLGKVSFMLAKERLENGNFSSAELYLAQVISLDLPRVLVDDAYFLLGDIRLAQEKYKEAESCYIKVLSINRFAKSRIVREAEERLKIVKNMEVKS